MSDYSEIFGREPELWRGPLGALRLTLTGDPEKVDVIRAQGEVEALVKVLNEHLSVVPEGPEVEWEYECRVDPSWDWRTCTNDARFCPKGSERRRRRAAGPWLPVEQGGE